MSVEYEKLVELQIKMEQEKARLEGIGSSLFAPLEAFGLSHRIDLLKRLKGEALSMVTDPEEKRRLENIG